MPAGDRMPDIRPRLFLLFGQRRQMRVVDLVEPLPGKARATAHDLAAHVGRERSECGVGVGVERVAFGGRQLERMNERAGIRQHLVFAI